MRRAFLLIGLLLALQAHAGTVLQLESPLERVAVLELFTSHGCSSCPPADRWLRRLVDRPGLWREVVPLAFHVDYWDGLGWPDRFASGRYSQRQGAYRASGRVGSVYTPGFVLNGREWRGWLWGEQAELSPGPAIGRLSLGLDGKGSVEVRFDPVGGSQTRGLTAHVALLGFGLSTPVGGGENAGRTLEEDFVVLGYTSTTRNGNRDRWQMDLPETVSAQTSRRAVAAWISADTDPAPIQAVAGWLP